MPRHKYLLGEGLNITNQRLKMMDLTLQGMDAEGRCTNRGVKDFSDPVYCKHGNSGHGRCTINHGKGLFGSKMIW